MPQGGFGAPKSPSRCLTPLLAEGPPYSISEPYPAPPASTITYNRRLFLSGRSEYLLKKYRLKEY